MRLLTTRLHEPARSATRFVLLGQVGTALQYGVYYGLLYLIDRYMVSNYLLTNAAFVTGFILEMVFNYFMTNYYTFHTKPNWTNLGGFLGARGVNFVLQMILLNLLLAWMSEELAGIVAIMLAGVVNYFILRWCFAKSKKTDKSNTQ